MNESISINDRLSQISTDRANIARTRSESEVLGGGFEKMLQSKQRNADALHDFGDTATDRQVGSDRDKLRDAAEQLVSSTFILPLLAQMRDSPFKSELLHGGKGEDAFGAQLDTILADRIVESGNFALVDQIEQQMLKQSTAMQNLPFQP